jgi:shikimate kinase/3-dehydroquinate synthase
MLPLPQIIALQGFMGAGKTALGKLLAQALQRPFVDLDAEVTAQTGQTPAQLLSQGAAPFRRAELQALKLLLQGHHPCVLALGGGTLTQPEAQALIAKNAFRIYLRTGLHSITARLAAQGAGARPLWQHRTEAQRAELYAERRAAYAQADLTVDTDAHSPQALVAQLLQALQTASETRRVPGTQPAPGAQPAPQKPAAALAQGQATITLQVAATAPSLAAYQLLLSQRADAWLHTDLPRSCPGPAAFVLTDAHVAPLHAAAVVAALQAAGRRVVLHTVPAGEASKSLACAAEIYEHLAAQQMDRSACLVAVGGGVVGDLGGFVAATYRRGMALVHLPTTTLAAVDSSLGGKNAVNGRTAKNSIGTFYVPRAVFIAMDWLATQTPRCHAAGLVEVVKVAATHSAALLQTVTEHSAALLRGDSDRLLEVITAALRIKAAVVAADPFDTGARGVLNFGHTFGHAIEVGEAYQLLHGEAVGLGMLYETAWAHSQQLCGPQVHQALLAALLPLNVPTDFRHAKVSVEAMKLDKKRQGSQVRLPIVVQIGTHDWQSVDVDTLATFASLQA